MSKSKLPDDAELRRLYLDEDLSKVEIAEKFDVWTHTVRVRLKKAGIARPKREIERSQLEQFYVNQRLSLGDVAKIVGFSSDFVRSELLRHNIPIRQKYFFDHALLYKMYVTDGLIMKEIAEVLGCSIGTVMKEIVRNGITERHPTSIRRPAPYSGKQFYELYVEQRLNQREIAAMGGFHESKIGYWLKKYGFLLKKGPMSAEEKRRVEQMFDCMIGSKLPDQMELRRLYVEENLTLDKIAGLFGVSRQSVSQKLSEFGIIRTKPVLQPGTILELYVDQRKSLNEMSRILGRSSTYIRKQLLHENIPLRGRKSFVIEHDLLYSMYVTKGMIMREIAEKIGCSQAIVEKEIRRHGIRERHSTWARRNAVITRQ